jgi:hypothetical protein
MEGDVQPLTRGMIEDGSIVGRKMLADCFDERWMTNDGKRMIDDCCRESEA